MKTPQSEGIAAAKSYFSPPALPPPVSAGSGSKGLSQSQVPAIPLADVRKVILNVKNVRPANIMYAFRTNFMDVKPAIKSGRSFDINKLAANAGAGIQLVIQGILPGTQL